MPNYRLVPPVIRWGANLANAIYFPFPLDNVFSGSEPRAGSEVVQAPSGVEAAWRVGTDYLLTGAHRWIAQSDTIFYPRCTGWDGTLGIRAALEYLQNKNTFSWHPDGRNLVRTPGLNNASHVTLATFPANTAQSYWVGFADAGVTGVSITFDSGVGAWKLVGTNPTGGALAVNLVQLFPAIPGETMVAAVDCQASGLGGGADLRVRLGCYSSGVSFITSPVSDAASTATSFARVATAVSSPLPSGTAFVSAQLLLRLPSGGATGTAWFKNYLIRRDSTDTTFIDNPSVDGCYLVEPIQYSPANEGDGSRQLVTRIRNPSTPFDGY